ncbi:MAG TPA: GNAT family N-acetyltransferase [Nocardioides sp.]|nr:GNAT family N-acetyltransferase [Nocardioides sp.]
MADPGPVLPEGVRNARPEDVPDVLRLIRALADYEREPDAVETTEADLRRWLFGDDPVASVLVAESGGTVVGMALWFRTYSTWTGVPGIHLEDLFVDPAARGSGWGRALLAGLASIAIRRGYRRVEWVVLDWNTPSLEFYEALGARPLKEWSTYRLAGDALAALAGA